MTEQTVSKPTILVLGATGGVGGAVADAMLKRGWAVRGLARDAAKAAEGRNGGAIDWIEGDSMKRSDVVAAATGAEVILHAVNPPGYQKWEELVLPMIDNSIAAARATGARIVLPGTLYNYDPRQALVVDEHTPQTAKGRKGRVRIAMEQRLRDAAPAVKSIVLRAGDFFGPSARSTWFSQAMVRPGQPVRRVSHPGVGVPHSYAYLPDLAEAFARVIEARERMAPFEMLHFTGFFDADGGEMATAIARAAERPVSVSGFPWWLMRLMSPVNGFMREVVEVKPYWRHPMRFDNTRLEQLIGPEPHTPVDVAVRAALADIGSL